MEVIVYSCSLILIDSLNDDISRTLGCYSSKVLSCDLYIYCITYLVLAAYHLGLLQCYLACRILNFLNNLFGCIYMALTSLSVQ